MIATATLAFVCRLNSLSSLIQFFLLYISAGQNLTTTARIVTAITIAINFLLGGRTSVCHRSITLARDAVAYRRNISHGSVSI